MVAAFGLYITHLYLFIFFIILLFLVLVIVVSSYVFLIAFALFIFLIGSVIACRRGLSGLAGRGFDIFVVVSSTVALVVTGVGGRRVEVLFLLGVVRLVVIARIAHFDDVLPVRRQNWCVEMIPEPCWR